MAKSTQIVDRILTNDWTTEIVDNALVEIYIENSRASLEELGRLLKFHWDGVTFKWEIRRMLNLMILNWGVDGINELINLALASDDFSIQNETLSFLSYCSAGIIEKYPAHVNSMFTKATNRGAFDSREIAEDVKLVAKAGLIRISKEIETEEKFPHSLLATLNTFLPVEAQTQVFAAMIMRWFHLNENGLEQYLALIGKTGITEYECHEFLRNNPYLIEPFHAQIWSKPRFGEELVPDFLLRSIDDSYTVIEIEELKKSILTKAGNLSAQASHAKRQALEYRDWISSNHLYVKERYKNILRPTALVVIGMEGKLTPEQRVRLNQENESTAGVVRIVGFDWIYYRAKATYENFLKYGFERQHPIN